MASGCATVPRPIFRPSRPATKANVEASPAKLGRGFAREGFAEGELDARVGRRAAFAEDALGEAGNIFEEHRLALAVRADDEVVERKRQLDDGIKARERSVAGPHLLDEDAGMAAAEEVDHAAGLDGFGEPVGGGLDRKSVV